MVNDGNNEDPKELARNLSALEAKFRLSINGATSAHVNDFTHYTNESTGADAAQACAHDALMAQLNQINDIAKKDPAFAKTVFEETRNLDASAGYYPEFTLDNGRLNLKPARKIQDDEGEASVRKAFNLALSASALDVARADDHTVAQTHRLDHPEWQGLSDGKTELEFTRYTKDTLPPAPLKYLKGQLGLNESAGETQVWQRLLNDLQPDLKRELHIPDKVDDQFAQNYMSDNGKQKLLKYMRLDPNMNDLALQNFVFRVTVRDSTSLQHRNEGKTEES